MKSAKAILILVFYATSILGYGTLYFLHSLAHRFENPIHHHQVAPSHHHYFEDHGASKFLMEVQAESDYQQAIKIVKALYFFSFYEDTDQLKTTFKVVETTHFSFSINFFSSLNSAPPSPPPDPGNLSFFII